MDGQMDGLVDCWMSAWMGRLLSKLVGGIVDCWMGRMVDEWIDRISVSLISVSLISSHLSLSIFSHHDDFLSLTWSMVLPIDIVHLRSTGLWWMLLE